MRLKEKQTITEQLHEKLLKSKIVLVTDYKGLNVAKVTELRKALKEADIEYKVAKNTLIKRAAEATDAELIRDHFVGPNALALSYDDLVTPAKLLMAFTKENKNFEIKIGVMGGKIIDFDAIKRLAELPSREVLLSQMLSAMNAVPTGMVTVLSQVPRGLLNVLQAIKDQKEAA